MLDSISVKGIEKSLDSSLKGKLNIEIKECSESTNDDVKNLARIGGTEGSVIIACRQTCGKGRLGRAFFSPDNTGVYMSLLLRPDLKPEDATLITTAAAVSVCKALSQMGVNNSAIKWVNDVYLNDKKVCGILTEAGFDASGKLSFAVLGVGLNMYEPAGGFPDDIKNIAGAVFSEKQEGLEDRFIAGFLNAFYEFYVDITSKKHIAEYKRLCFLYGREVDVIKGDSVRQARVSGLDDNCGLIVEYADGEKDVLTSGEVSLKVKK